MRPPFGLSHRSFAVFALISSLGAASCAPVEESEIVETTQEDQEEGDSVGVDEATAIGVRVPASLGINREHTIYLTFDDGPSGRYTPRILEILARHHAPATFFITGASIAGNEALLRREETEGHVVASHQWSHVVASTSQFNTWLPRERNALDQALGHPHPRLFRYPYGAGNSVKEAALRAGGYPDGGIGWDFDSLDWCFGARGTCTRSEVPSAYRSDFEGYVMNQIQRRGTGGVILFHDVQSITANHLDSILTKMEQAGFHFAALPTEGR